MMSARGLAEARTSGQSAERELSAANIAFLEKLRRNVLTVLRQRGIDEDDPRVYGLTAATVSELALAFSALGRDQRRAMSVRVPGDGVWRTSAFRDLTELLRPGPGADLTVDEQRIWSTDPTELSNLLAGMPTQRLRSFAEYRFVQQSSLARVAVTMGVTVSEVRKWQVSVVRALSERASSSESASTKISRPTRAQTPPGDATAR